MARQDKAELGSILVGHRLAMAGQDRAISRSGNARRYKMGQGYI